MSLSSYPNRVLWIAALASGIVFACCGGVAYYLDVQQAHTAAFLSENIHSRKAADNLEEALASLVAYHESGKGDVALLQDRVKLHLAEIEQLSDKPREQELSGLLQRQVDAYLSAYRMDESAFLILKNDAIRLCQDLQNFNEGEIEESEREHRVSVRRMSWGLLAVGALGSLAGLLLGYGLARSLRQTIHQFLVRVQGASEKLGQGMSTIEWHRQGLATPDGAEELLHQVEMVVQKLQDNDREMRRSERLAAVGQLAAGVAHEIRNPLTSAILLLETSRKDPQAGGLTDEDLDLIEQEMHRIETTLNTFLEFARPPRLERRECDLLAIVGESLHLARGRIEQQGIEVEFLPSSDAVPLHADPHQLRQVVVNLILNALDMMPAGGRLEIAAKREESPPAVLLNISDSGPGIRDDILARLFEPFATGKETGLGLGLVISKRIVEEHAGAIVGYNRSSGGACFEVRLPLTGGAA